MSVGAVILAAGKGNRFGEPKQFEDLSGKPYWQHVRDNVLPITTNIVTVGIDIPGGATRSHSVLNGLKALDDPRVLILEAARPLVSTQLMRTLLEHDEHSVAFGFESTYTIYYHSRTMGQYRHLLRNECMELHVPQLFTKHLLLEAYNAFDDMPLTFTSDTQYMQESLGIFPTLVDVPLKERYQLFKATYPEDRAIIQGLYNAKVQ